MKATPSYFRYWGKAEKDGSGYHLLPYHCLDVAAVGWLLLDPHKPLCQRLAQQLLVTPSWLQQWLTFCLSLHDVGKFATAFQSLMPNMLPELVPSNPRMSYTERHDTLGFVLWQEILAGSLAGSGGFGYAANQPEIKKIFRYIDPWIEIVTGHHGEPPKRMPIRRQNFFTEADEEAACQFCNAVTVLFLSEGDAAILSDKGLKQRLRLSSWNLAGVVVLADWLGSGRNSATYCQTKMTLEEYWGGHALPFAEDVISKADITQSTVSLFSGTKHLFPFISSLTPLQSWAEKRQLLASNQLFILEDVTGAGKTEAALVLAHRLMANGLADGIYVALPTMATANAMYERLGKAYRRLFTDDQNPSLVLAHGARHLSDGFRTSVGLSEASPAKQSYYDDDVPGEVYCSAWLADSRKKALLAEVGVGTLDQALLAVLPARHQSLRLLGLARKVLIVDEVHAYDPYMNQLLQTLLEFHARQGGSAILLSATLPQQMRGKYINAFCSGAGVEKPTLQEDASYPLATHVPTIEMPETSLETRRVVERSVAVTIISETDHAMGIIKEAVEKGLCACWIRNTVNDARDAYNLLSNRIWINKNKLSLFHSRFAMVDRKHIESQTLDLFGKASASEKRMGRVLVATQVVEQSLDLDFDVMISDIAPIDLLIQRAGRLHRHVRDANGDPLLIEGAIDRRGVPHLYVFGPAPTMTPDEDWLKLSLPGTQAVYKHVGQLWLTQQQLCPIKENADNREGKINMPASARVLIEGVFGEAEQEKVPESLQGLSWNAEGEDGSKKGMARLNALKMEKGYTRSSAEDSGGWDKETRIPTRLGDNSITVALARICGCNLQPYADTTEFAWELSMVDVPDYEWKKVRDKIPAGLQTAIAKLKEEASLLKWVEVLPMTEEIHRFYDPGMGWGFDDKEDKR